MQFIQQLLDFLFTFHQFSFFELEISLNIHHHLLPDGSIKVLPVILPHKLTQFRAKLHILHQLELHPMAYHFGEPNILLLLLHHLSDDLIQILLVLLVDNFAGNRFQQVDLVAKLGLAAGTKAFISMMRLLAHKAFILLVIPHVGKK